MESYLPGLLLLSFCTSSKNATRKERIKYFIFLRLKQLFLQLEYLLFQKDI